MDRLEDAIRTVWVSNRSSTQSGLQVETWWGDEDGMVPKQGQGQWLCVQTGNILICLFRVVEQAVRIEVRRAGSNGTSCQGWQSSRPVSLPLLQRGPALEATEPSFHSIGRRSGIGQVLRKVTLPE